MGLGSRELDMILKLRKDGYIPSHGSVVEIGAQQLSNDFLKATQLIGDIARAFGIAGVPALPQPGNRSIGTGGVEMQADDAPRSEAFWQWLGYEYAAVDVDNSPGAIPLDLNFDPVPAAHLKRYDLVLNAGTTEHVANQLNAMQVVHELTKVRGTMIHRLPAQGFTNHGLINYNLKFFWMLSRSNVYKWVIMDFEANQSMLNIDPDIVTALKEFNPQSVAQVEKFRAADCSVTVAMQKLLDIDFVPPLDVRTGTDVNMEVLRKRYWTVFDTARVEREVRATRRKRWLPRWLRAR